MKSKTFTCHYINILSVLFIAAPFSIAADQQCDGIPEQIEAQIKSHAEEIRGAEYCQFRELTTGDLNADGVTDYVISYNIEGACYDSLQELPGSCGNKYSAFLSAFLKEGNSYKRIGPIEVGGRAKRAITGVRVSAKNIELDTKEYAKTDPACCPSVKATLKFVLKDQILSERELR